MAGGGLLLGFNWFSSEAQTSATIINGATGGADLLRFNSYLSIGTDGMVTIFSPNPELGQNIMTSFSMIVAEELDADWTKVKVVQAPLDPQKFERQITGGSGATPHSWKRLRNAGATARHLLIAAAAKQWNVDPSECTASDGFVIHKSSNRKSGYGDLVAAAATMPVPESVPLKDRKDFKLIGKPLGNLEIKNIITGKPIFGSDFHRDGMVLAMVQRPPAFGSKIKSVDDAAVR